MSQKPLKEFSTATRICSYVRGSLGRIAKRRYTRDLFDDIVECVETNSDIKVSDEEKLLTLFRCFNNFFNKKFDGDRLFKGLGYVMTKERSKIINNWLKQKKADNIYVIGRFILHISSFLEDQREVPHNQIKECGTFLNLIFCESSGVLDENLILIFSFLSRKGYFRSLMGFILKHYKINIKTYIINEKIKDNELTSLETWITFLVFPLKFSVKWRIKVEDWLKAEAEKTELYGSNGSLDDDYASTSIMNMSLMSVSSEYSNEDPHSRQTRLFLRRLLSSWCNSVYFNDSFYQYYISNLSIYLSNHVLVNTVPVYLIILALVEPTRQKRKYSLESVLSYNKNLSVQYKLNANPSLGLLSLLISGICSFQQMQLWINVCQEEAYGIIVCLHLTISALFDHSGINECSEESNIPRSPNHKMEDMCNLNENLKGVLVEVREEITKSVSHIIKIALSGLIDPDVVLPLAYFYQNLKVDFKASEYANLSCRLILSKSIPFLRYLWSLCQQAVTMKDPNSFERNSSDSFEKSIIFKLISDGKSTSVSDMNRFLSILSTMLECVTFHLNTLYQAETRRISSSSYGPSPAAVCSNFLFWPELWNMTSELAILSIGLIKIAVSCVNLKETDIFEIHCQCRINMSSKQCQEIIVEKIQKVLRLIQIFYIHIDKLNIDNISNDDAILDINPQIITKMFTKEKIQSIFDDKNFIFNLKDNCNKESSDYEETIELLKLKYLPQSSYKQLKILLMKTFLNQFKGEFSENLNKQQQSEVININYEKSSHFKESFHHIIMNKNMALKDYATIVLNGVSTDMKTFVHQILHEGFDPSNHLFSCDGNQLIYPNPYVESFNNDYKIYYEILGELFAMNILYGNQSERKFSPFFIEKLLFVNESIYNINDLNTIDMEVAKNLLLLSKTDDELDCFNFKFVLTQNTFGKLHTYNIVENGDQIPVTKDNKNEYIHGVVEFLLDKQIKVQCESFRKGINSIFPIDIFTLLSTKDFHQVLSDN